MEAVASGGAERSGGEGGVWSAREGGGWFASDGERGREEWVGRVGKEDGWWIENDGSI